MSLLTTGALFVRLEQLRAEGLNECDERDTWLEPWADLRGGSQAGSALLHRCRAGRTGARGNRHSAQWSGGGSVWRRRCRSSIPGWPFFSPSRGLLLLVHPARDRFRQTLRRALAGEASRPLQPLPVSGSDRAAARATPAGAPCRACWKSWHFCVPTLSADRG